MKLSFSTLACDEWSWETICQKGAEYGYQGVDLRYSSGRKDPLQNPEFSPQNVDKARQVAESHKILIPCVASGVLLSRKGQIAQGKSCIELAQSLRSPRMRVFMGKLEDGVSEDDALFLAAEQGYELADYGKERGVKVLLETHDFCIASEKTLEIVERVDHSNFGVIWDTHHTRRMAGEMPAQSWGLLAPFCDYLHVKDSLGTCDSFSYSLAGEGNLFISDLMNLIVNEEGIEWLCVEWERTWHPNLPDATVALPQYAEYLQKFLLKK